MSPVLAGALASLAAGAATGIGALPLFFAADFVKRLENAALGFAAGVMLAASFFSLLNPALARAGDDHGAAVSAFIVAGGLLLGGGFVWVANRFVPHRHFVTGPEGASIEGLRRIWLFILAITIHNLPEGMAVGVGYGSGGSEAHALALGIGLQNMAEGMAVAVALLGEGYSRRSSAGIALLTGLVEPVGGLIGATAVTLAQALLPWGLAFAAGAMIFVISHEIIPETHRKEGSNTVPTASLMLGLVVMMILDHTFG